MQYSSLIWFPADGKIHRCKELRLAALGQCITSHLELIADRLGALGNDAQELEEAEAVMCDKLAAGARPPAQNEVPECLCLPKVTLKRVVPRNRVGAVGEVLLVNELKANSLDSLASHSKRTHLGDTVADFDTVGKLLVRRNGWVPCIRHAPFVDTELGNLVRPGANKIARVVRTIPPGLRILKISPYTPSHVGAWQVASMA